MQNEKALIHLLYTSRASEDISDALLLKILETARRNNARLSVTGLLLCRERRFLQLLEGDRDTVTLLYKSIARDDRHRAVRVLVETIADKRLFPQWSMGFVEPKLTTTSMADLWPDVERALADEPSASTRIMGALRRFNSQQA